MLAGKDASLGENTARALICTLGDDGRVRLKFHQVENLAITEEEHDTGLHHVLEDEVFIVVANLIDVTHD